MSALKKNGRPYLRIIIYNAHNIKENESHYNEISNNFMKL